MKNIFVLGGTSAIAQAVCRTYAAEGAGFFLVGRDLARLEIVATDLRTRGAGRVECHATAGQADQWTEYVTNAFASFGRFDVYLAAQGSLPLQDAVESDPQLLTEFFQSSVVELMQVSLLIASQFEKQGSGSCVIIGSVAGDRGRRGNFVYGAGKAALDTFCEGLRQRLSAVGPVIIVKPGPVDSPMTKHLAKTALFTTPEKVASVIRSAIRRRAAVVYAPFFWRYIMLIIRFLPRSVVKGLRA